MSFPQSVISLESNGTSDPAFTLAIDNLGVSTITRQSVGAYQINTLVQLTANKTSIICQLGDRAYNNDELLVYGRKNGLTSVEFTVYDSNQSRTDDWSLLTVTIIVYP
jgi:hypothetical protein